MSESTKPTPKFKVDDRVISVTYGSATVIRVLEAWWTEYDSEWAPPYYLIRPDYNRYYPDDREDRVVLERGLRLSDTSNSSPTH